MVDESVDEYLDIVGKMFGSEDDGFEFYNSYALEKGFSVRKSYVEWDEANQEIIMKLYDPTGYYRGRAQDACCLLSHIDATY
ncbi:hypothetical protein BRADI_3g17302v3 [Brachypodium distachyon]|uniref:Uncharacterized protein n=1 Tax=Brachypodium distachyon TaxID=15368 RepID=A0A2K2CXQ3_BRADI|nr:hypothetical protein BRADI_3g17302v3 [Brachypodium distachyon]